MRRFVPLAALLGVAFVLGCQDVGTGMVASDGPGPQFAKPGACDPPQDPPHPSCKDGGGEPTEADATVVLTGGLITSAAQDVQVRRDNGSSLRVTRDVFTSQIDLSATHTAGVIACTQAGVFDEGLTQQALLDLVKTNPRSRSFFANIDKIDFTGGFNEISHTWVQLQPLVSGSLFFKIGGLVKKMTVPPGGKNPEIMLQPETPSAGKSTVTYKAGFGIVTIKQLSGSPKDHPRLWCPLRDKIVMIIDQN